VGPWLIGGLLALAVGGGLLLRRSHAFTPASEPPPAEVEKLVQVVLDYEADLSMLRAIAQKLTQAGYGAQAAKVMGKAFKVEAKALGVSEVQLAMQRSSMFYPGGS
jgi:hypothetical protein